MAPCLMWKPLSATLVICCASVGCVTVPLLPETVAWRKFRKLLPVLTSMVAKCGDQRNLSCGSSAAMTVTWSVLWHERQRRNTLRFTTTETWLQGHYICPSLSASQMVWPCTMGHVLYQNYPKLSIPDTRKKGRPWKTWSECVKTDVNECSLAGVDPLYRDAWRASVRHSLVLPTPWDGTQTAAWHIDAETRWPLRCRRCFKMHFLEWKCVNLA